MIIKSLITVKLESPEGDAIFKIRRPKKNVQLEFTAKIRGGDDAAKSEAYDAFVKAMCESVAEVQGLELEDGSPVTAEQFNKLDVDSVLVEQLAAGYIAALTLRGGDDTIEKKDSKSE